MSLLWDWGHLPSSPVLLHSRLLCRGSSRADVLGKRYLKFLCKASSNELSLLCPRCVTAVSQTASLWRVSHHQIMCKELYNLQSNWQQRGEIVTGGLWASFPTFATANCVSPLPPANMSPFLSHASRGPHCAHHQGQMARYCNLLWVVIISYLLIPVPTLSPVPAVHWAPICPFSSFILLVASRQS